MRRGFHRIPAAAHDAIGHGVLGLCHVDGNLIGGSRLSLMSFGVGVFSNNLPSLLTAFDLAAIQPVFRSGLLPGSTLFDFTRVGLVGKPGSTSSAQSTPRSTAVHTAVIDAPPTR